MRRRLFCVLVLAAAAGRGLTQGQSILLTNPSFEDAPEHSRQPAGWHNCGFPGESPPDTQPNNEFAVTKPAAEGSTYLGLVVRDNETWESVSQRLNTPMEAGQCFQFSISLARSEMYVSLSRTNPERTVNYVTPAKLRIYGGFGHCDRKELLAESSLIISYKWKRHTFKLNPKQNYTYLLLEAYYDTPVMFPYNGNLLVDHASALDPLDCREEVPENLEELAQKEPEEQPSIAASPPPPINNAPNPAPAQPEPTPVPANPLPPATSDPGPSRVKAKSFADLTKEDLRTGQTLRIENLYFEADKSVITSNSFATLDELYSFLRKNKGVVVEIGGHTNSLPPDDYCDRLSTQRAKSVADYLVSKGIPDSQVQYKGYGKRFPVDSNNTLQGRKRNQRVEVKILSISEN